MHVGCIPHSEIKQCVLNDVCNKTFNITIIKLELYSSLILPDVMSHIMNICCGVCKNVSVIAHLPGMANVNLSLLSSSHFVYPILGCADNTHMHGF